MNTRTLVTIFILLIVATIAVGMLYARFKDSPISVNHTSKQSSETKDDKHSNTQLTNTDDRNPHQQDNTDDYRPPARVVNQQELKPDPKLIVLPVAMGEEPDEEKVKGQSGYVSLGSGGGWIMQTNGVRRIVIPGVVLNNYGEMEFFACVEGSGKDYETVLKLYCDNVHKLQYALMLYCRLKKGPLPEKLGGTDKKQGDRALVFVQWKDKNGKVVTHRAEDLVIDRKRETAMPRVGFTYTGSYFEEQIDPDTKKVVRSVFAADMSKSIITTIRDRTALLDNPLPEADDHIGIPANYSVLPPPGTPIKIIIRAPNEGEKNAITELEKKLAD
ncbi:MAG: hypothetical protein A2W23_09820 [Planctomycetes bacterium RBG_16_43_13]|nr:MAG: hypothetical protein A2W23_09820 [Planctomycetes bacterium RBG_16_43_13]